MPQNLRPFTSFLTGGNQSFPLSSSSRRNNIGQINPFPSKPVSHIKPPEDELPEGWEWQLVEGNWEPVSIGGESSPPSPGTGTRLSPPSYLQEPPPFAGHFTGFPSEEELWDIKTGYDDMAGGFDVNNDGVVDMLDFQATQQQGALDWAQSLGPEAFYGGGFDFGQYQNLMWEHAVAEGNSVDSSTGEPWHSSAQEWWATLHPDTQHAMNYSYAYWPSQGETQWSYGGSDEGMSSWQFDMPVVGYDWVPGEQWNPDWVDSTQMPPPWEDPFPYIDTTGAYYQPGYLEESQQGFLENLASYLNPANTQDAQEFTGGGGQGGGLAKKLYYPGTSGGFAGVGSGISGGGGMQSMLQSLMG